MSATVQLQSSQSPSLEQQLGTTLRNRRVEHGLKVSEVAKLANISQGMVSKIENAQVSTSLDTLKRLCDALGSLHHRELRFRHGVPERSH